MPAFIACHGSCALREIVLINITGEDRPGLTAAITGVLAQGGVNILDIGRSDPRHAVVRHPDRDSG